MQRIQAQVAVFANASHRQGGWLFTQTNTNSRLTLPLYEARRSGCCLVPWPFDMGAQERHTSDLPSTKVPSRPRRWHGLVEMAKASKVARIIARSRSWECSHVFRVSLDPRRPRTDSYVGGGSLWMFLFSPSIAISSPSIDIFRRTPVFSLARRWRLPRPPPQMHPSTPDAPSLLPFVPGAFLGVSAPVLLHPPTV